MSREPQVYEISFTEENHWEVRNVMAGTYADGLTWDEMLGHLVVITCPKTPSPDGLYAMKTAEGWEAEREARAARRRATE